MSEGFEAYMRRLDLLGKVSKSARERSQEASYALKRSAESVLGGKRTGRIYKIPGSKRRYQASAPKEAPGQKSRDFRRSWYIDPQGINPKIDTQDSEIARIMSKGAKRTTRDGKVNYLQRRPFVRRIKKRAKRSLTQIYKRPYLPNTNNARGKWVIE